MKICLVFEFETGITIVLSSWSISLPSTLKKLHSISPTAPCLSNSLASTSVMKQSTKVGASRSIPAMETNAASDPLEQGGLKFNLRKGTNLYHR